MKRVLLLMFSSLFIIPTLTCKKDVKPKSDFYLKINLLNSETSKDSNSQKTEIVIKNHKISYQWNYEGYHPDEDLEDYKKVNRELDTGELKKIIDNTQKMNILKNVEEKSKKGSIGIATSLSLEMHMKQKKTFIHISGMLNMWGNDDYVKNKWGKQYIKTRTNLKNNDLYKKIVNIISLIESMVLKND